MAVDLENSSVSISERVDFVMEEVVYVDFTEAIYKVGDVLDGVAMAHNMVSQDNQDQYDDLVSVLDPSRRGAEAEALLVTAAKALIPALHKLNSTYHGSLLSNIFSINIWNYHTKARETVLELITSMAAVPEKFLDSCLYMIVNNFMPPRRLRENPNIKGKSEIHVQLREALRHIARVVPLSPMKLRDMLDRKMPKHTDPKEVIIAFVECMLGLEDNEIGEYLGNTVLSKVIELLTELDVNIHWEDILQEEHNKGIFDMELENVGENGTDAMVLSGKSMREAEEVLSGNVFAAKLDSLMVIIFDHLKTCDKNRKLADVFDMLTESFMKTLMNAYKSKFAQFVMFYACSLDPETCGKKFAYLLTDIFLSEKENPLSRMSAAAYLASYLARATFASSTLVATVLQRLVNWCAEYCQRRKDWDKTRNLTAHRVFYSGCQAVMYVLCFQMRSLMDVTDLKSQIFNPFEPVLCHPLDPFKVCLPTIVREFVRQSMAARLFKPSRAVLSGNMLETVYSRTFGGDERLDMFFPFDPYLLKESDEYITKENKYLTWTQVKKTYSNCNSDCEDEDLDVPDVGTLDGGGDADFESEDEDEDLDYSMNKMSITPRPAFHHPTNGGFRSLSQMPARIRPSVSPED